MFLYAGMGIIHISILNITFLGFIDKLDQKMTVTPSFHYYIFNIIFCCKLDLSRVSASNADFFN